MKVKDLLNLIKTEKPNSFSDEMLLGYINEIEAEVQDQMEIVPVTSYDLKRDMDKDLLVKPPYDNATTYCSGSNPFGNCGCGAAI